MKRTINLQPKQNSGESVSATIAFEERIMSLNLQAQSYGNHMTTLFINFNSPEDVRKLAFSLINMANEADRFFQENP